MHAADAAMDHLAHLVGVADGGLADAVVLPLEHGSARQLVVVPLCLPHRLLHSARTHTHAAQRLCQLVGAQRLVGAPKRLSLHRDIMRPPDAGQARSLHAAGRDILWGRHAACYSRHSAARTV